MEASWKLDVHVLIRAPQNTPFKKQTNKQKNHIHKEEQQQKSNVYTFVLYNEMEEQSMK